MSEHRCGESDPIVSADVRTPIASPKRWRGALVFLLVLLSFAIVIQIGLFYAINGPLFRKAAHFGGMKAAAAYGLQGDFEVTGTIFSGFGVRNLQLEGQDEDDPSLRISDFEIRYRMGRILTGASNLDWLDSLRIGPSKIRLTLPEPSSTPSPKKEEAPKSPSAPRPVKDFAAFWNLLASDIRIDDLSLVIQQGDRGYSVESFRLILPATGDGEISAKRISLLEQTPITEVAAAVTQTDHSLSLTGLDLPFHVKIQTLSFQETTPGRFGISSNLSVSGGEIDLSAGLDARQELALSVALKKDSVLSLNQIEIPNSQLRGRISSLKLSLFGELEKPNTWKVDGTLVGDDCAWGEYGVDSVRAQISTENLRLEASRGDARALIDAKLPLSQVASLEDLTTAAIDINAKVDIPSLAALLPESEKSIPIAGALSLDAREIRIVGDKLENGELRLTTDKLAWDEIPISEAQLSARIERKQFAKFALDFALDDTTRAHLVGSTDLDQKKYEAELNAEFAAKDRLAALLQTFGVEKVSGTGALEWKGAGSFDSNAHRQTTGLGHSGEGQLSLRDLAVPGVYPLSGALSVTYANQDVTIPPFTLSTEKGKISGSGNWDGETLRLTDWKLSRGGEVPLLFSLSTPTPSAPDQPFLKQEKPLSAQVSLDGLSMEDLSAFLEKLPNLDGTLHGDITAAGSFQSIDLQSNLVFRPDHDTDVKEDSTVAVVTNPQKKEEEESAGETRGESTEETSEILEDTIFSLALKGAVERPSSWKIDLDAKVGNLRWGDQHVPRLQLTAKPSTEQPDSPLLVRLHLDQSTALLDAVVTADLHEAHSFVDLPDIPLSTDLSLEIGSLSTALRDFVPGEMKHLPLSGQISAKLNSLKLIRGAPESGEFSLQSSDFAIDGNTFSTLHVSAKVAAPNQIEADWNLALDEATHVQGDGFYRLTDHNYRGSLDLKADMQARDSRLHAILANRPAAALVPGVTDIVWRGEGSIREKKHSGTLALHSKALQLAAEAVPISLDIEGNYTATSAHFPTLKIHSEALQVDGSLDWKDQQVTLQARGNSEGREVLAIQVNAPLDPEKATAEKWFAQEEALNADFVITALPLATVSRIFQPKPAILGDLSLDLAATGTSASPNFTLKTRLDGLAVPREEQPISVGIAELQVETKGEKILASGSYRYPQIEPLTIHAEMPFHPGAWAAGDTPVAEEAISASAIMGRSPLGFLTEQVPGIEFIEGVVSLDTKISGTIGTPKIQGNAALDVPHLRLENRDVPSLRDVAVLVHFGLDQIHIERIHALVAGGEVDGQGKITLKEGSDPDINIALKGSDVLVARTPDVSVRTDLDVTLSGPLSQATLSGEAGIVNSRYFRNFDLLPIGIPKMPNFKNSSALPTIERAPRGAGNGLSSQDLDLGVKQAPFENWPVDFRIYTKEPFLIRTNLAESSIDADIHIGGTLGNPSPLGQVEIQKGEMKLPFSKVNIETGRIEFDPSTGFNGAIEFKARAKADRYQIAIYLHDHILNPQYVLTSVPPLPSEDILTLIATGTTRDSLTGGDTESLAAEKAAGLLLKSLRQKSNKVDSEPNLLDFLEERTELDLGRINPETGEQTFGGKIRLWKQLFFVGDVDQRSDYRALLKYVFRFE